MVYNSGLVAVVKVDGKVLRESGEVVTLPFGSEYSILIKNLKSVRALVTVSIDGKDATEGVKLIVPANGEIELERFIRNGNFERGNRFKFIERTEQIEEHRGIGAEDGLIRVECWFEKPRPKPQVTTTKVIHEHHHHNHYNGWLGPAWHYVPSTFNLSDLSSNNLGQTQITTSGMDSVGASSYSCFTSNIGDSGSFTKSVNTSAVNNTVGAQNMARTRSFTRSAAAQTKGSPLRSFSMNEASLDFMDSLNDAGITVAGSESKQKFQTGSWFPTESESTVVVLKLKGKVGVKKVVQAVTVDHKPKCSTCGRTNKANAKFCSECGTALELI